MSLDPCVPAQVQFLFKVCQASSEVDSIFYPSVDLLVEQDVTRDHPDHSHVNGPQGLYLQALLPAILRAEEAFCREGETSLKKKKPSPVVQGDGHLDNYAI